MKLVPLLLLAASLATATPIVVTIEGVIDTWWYNADPTVPPHRPPPLLVGNPVKLHFSFDSPGFSGLVMISMIDKIRSAAAPYDANFNYGSWGQLPPPSAAVTFAAELPGGLTADNSCGSTGPCGSSSILVDLDSMQVIRASHGFYGGGDGGREFDWNPALGEDSWSAYEFTSSGGQVQMRGTITSATVADLGSEIPEPATVGLCGIALCGLAALRKFRAAGKDVG